MWERDPQDQDMLVALWYVRDGASCGSGGSNSGRWCRVHWSGVPVDSWTAVQRQERSHGRNALSKSPGR